MKPALVQNCTLFYVVYKLQACAITQIGDYLGWHYATLSAEAFSVSSLSARNWIIQL